MSAFREITKLSYFIFKGIPSYDYNILVNKQPDIISPELRTEEIIIPGRSGKLYTSDNLYESYTKTISCTIPDRAYLDVISAWLKGKGDIIFSNERDKLYKGFVKNQIPFSQVVREFRAFPVIFEVQPFKYAVNALNDTIIIQKSPFSFWGNGTVEAAPIINIYGNGNINLTINGRGVSLQGINERITINSEIMDAYKDNQNQNMKMAGEFPLLKAMENNIISYTGNVEKIEIIPQWRWI